MQRVAFPTDEHFPYQDEHARSVAMQITRDFNPTIRVSGSDGMDFYAISRFDKDPRRLKAGGLQREIDLWKKGQKEWRDASPEAKAIYIPGNHEDRLRRYLWNHPEIYELDVLRLSNLLGFAELGIDPIDQEMRDTQYLVEKKLLLKHGTKIRMHSAYSARAELENVFYSYSVMSGHTHRGGAHLATTPNGVVGAYECFCLCDLKPEYVQNPNWQQGICLAVVDKGNVSVEQIPFYRNKNKVHAIWREKEYTEE